MEYKNFSKLAKKGINKFTKLSAKGMKQYGKKFEIKTGKNSYRDDLKQEFYEFVARNKLRRK